MGYGDLKTITLVQKITTISMAIQSMKRAAKDVEKNRSSMKIEIDASLSKIDSNLKECKEK